MSTHVAGFVPPDEKWQKMRAVWDACKAAGVSSPRAVEQFFDGKDPSDNGMEVDITAAVVKYSTEYADGYEVDIKRLPPTVTRIRFYNSW